MTSDDPSAPSLTGGVVAQAALSRRQPIAVELSPDAPARAALAAALGLETLRKLSFAGRLIPVGRADWDLTATLGATVVQPCVVTFAPVTTRIDEPVVRRFRTALPDPVAGETEMPEDDTIEPMPAVLDLYAVVTEALALALPPFPRAADAPAVDVTVAPPGAEPLTGEAARPFAGLAALKGKLASEE